MADINGTSTILLNGTLPNETTATGGTENTNSGSAVRIGGLGSVWVVVVLVMGMVLLL
jgi:hypothetical protein